MQDIHEQKVLILDFGSQYTQLIARRIRESRVYCEIHPCTIGLEEINKFNPRALVLSGGPSSVHQEGSPLVDPVVFELGVPVLGICYGMQLMAHLLGGSVQPGSEELTLDHVVPRSHDGESRWDNCVLACLDCNKRKADRTPEQAGMRLRRNPVRPTWNPIYAAHNLRIESWSKFISEAYWNVELEK